MINTIKYDMSSKYLKLNTQGLNLDQRIKKLCDDNTIDGKEFAKLIGISPQYLTDIRHENKLKGNPIKFWKGILNQFPSWDSYLRGETDTPPVRKIAEFQDPYPPQTIQISDPFMQKTAAILESHHAIFSPALKANIDAFHHALYCEQQLAVAIDRIEALEKWKKSVEEKLSAVKSG